MPKKTRRVHFLVSLDLPPDTTRTDQAKSIGDLIRYGKASIGQPGDPTNVRARALTNADVLLKQNVFNEATDAVLADRPENGKKELMKATIRAFITAVNAIQRSRKV
ncbi:hypothetical protein [Roseococcus pinisoli]|uniref:Uncharacterized protein n=1 Tax=Roseococcus pinisoli TaxID=2835040 RepID=A0ABS5QF23_9PROT|nr:hypothetical protein [Roseococcus pinisoli]MBS7812271.1 hypothetical protein [Roseococcus pinisoli]